MRTEKKSSPEDYGGYYAWGETKEKSDYSWKTYKYWQDTDGDGSNELADIGSEISGTSYDVAHVKWGGGYRMPTLTEIIELLNNCSTKWTRQNGVYGCLYIGLNGNSIFLPAAGNRWGTIEYYPGRYGYYWSGTPHPSYSTYAYYLYFDYVYSYWYSDWNRIWGYSVRPVSK